LCRNVSYYARSRSGVCNNALENLPLEYSLYIGTVRGHIVDAPPSTTKFEPVM
jgi:hypothetical protein